MTRSGCPDAVFLYWSGIIHLHGRLSVEMSPIELVIDARNGDREAFSRLMSQHESGVMSVCRGFTKGEQDAEDLALEAFVEAYQKLHQLRQPESFGYWLRRITLNLCRSWYRSQKIALLELKIDPPLAEPDEVLDDLILFGMARLNDGHRNVLDLHYRAGRSYQEIADLLEMPIGTVMSRMHRAKKALRDVVELTEDKEMNEERDLQRVSRWKLSYWKNSRPEVEAAKGIRRVKADCEPMVRLRQVLETHPPRLVDLLHLSESDERLSHLAGVARHAMHATMPVMASCALSNGEVLSERASRMAEHWIVRTGHMRRDLYLFLDVLIASPADSERKARVLVRLMQAVRATGLQQEKGHHVMFELTRVLLGYPREAFPLLWEAVWELDEDDLVEYGVRKAIGLLLEPFTDAAIEVVRSGDRARILRLLGEIRPIFSSRSVFHAYMPHPNRLYQFLRVLLDSDDQDIIEKAKQIGVAHVEPAIPELITRSEDQDPSVRRKALQALGRRAEDSAKDAILKRLENDVDPEVRYAAVQAYAKVATDWERNSCLKRISKSGDRKLMKVAARALYVGAGPRQLTRLEEQRNKRIRGDAEPKKHIDPLLALKALPEIRRYDEDELTKVVAQVCQDYSTTRRQMVMEGRHSLMVREKGIYTFTQIGEAVWRVGRFTESVKRNLRLE